jgi:hypothetical protein
LTAFAESVRVTDWLNTAFSVMVLAAELSTCAFAGAANIIAKNAMIVAVPSCIRNLMVGFLIWDSSRVRNPVPHPRPLCFTA